MIIFKKGSAGSEGAGPDLCEESLPGAAGVQEALPQQSHELLPLQAPALHLVGALPIRAAEPVRLPGLCGRSEVTTTEKCFSSVSQCRC